MKITYSNYTNIDGAMLSGHQAGQRLIKGWSGTWQVDDYSDYTLMQLCEFLFGCHNADNRPDAQVCPSMSVGDVIRFNEPTFGTRSFTVEATGFSPTIINSEDMLDGTTWKEAVS